MSSSFRPSLIDRIYYRTLWAFQDRCQFFVDLWKQFWIDYSDNPLNACLLAGKVAVPMLLPLVFLWAMYMRDAPKDADGNYLPPRPRRIVPRPGTQAWVDYNRALADHLRSKQLTGAEEQLAIEEASSSATTTATAEKPTIAQSTSMMSAPATNLNPPLDTPITLTELAKYNGVPEGQKIYIGIKGTVFDVTPKAEMYGPGKSYNVFAGKDGSKGLGLSSLKPEDAIPDYSSLDEKSLQTLNQWYSFFEKRYNIIGKVSGP